MNQKHLLISGLLLITAGIIGAISTAAGHKLDAMPIDIDDLSYEQAVQKLAIPFRKDLPQLFVSGDSISVGYAPALKLALKSRMNCVHRRDLPTQFPAIARQGLVTHYSGAGPSVISLTTAVLKAPDYKPNVFLLNFGLHDVDGGGQRYEKTLAALITLAKQHQVTLVWVQTTSKANGRPENTPIQEFNKIAARLMAAAHVPVIDLNAFSTQLIAQNGLAMILRTDHVHFTTFASEAQGRFIAVELMKILEGKQH